MLLLTLIHLVREPEWLCHGAGVAAEFANFVSFLKQRPSVTQNEMKDWECTEVGEVPVSLHVRLLLYQSKKINPWME